MKLNEEQEKQKLEQILKELNVSVSVDTKINYFRNKAEYEIAREYARECDLKETETELYREELSYLEKKDNLRPAIKLAKKLGLEEKSEELFVKLESSLKEHFLEIYEKYSGMSKVIYKLEEEAKEYGFSSRIPKYHEWGMNYYADKAKEETGLHNKRTYLIYAEQYARKAGFEKKREELMYEQQEITKQMLKKEDI